MTNSPTAIILAGRRGTRRRAGGPAGFPKFLGTTTPGLVLEAVRAVRPGKITAVFEKPDPDLEPWFKEAGIPIVRSIRGALGPRASGDVLIIEARLPLILGASLKALIARHRKSGNFATVLCPPGACDRRAAEKAACPVAVFRMAGLKKVLASSTVRGNALGSLADLVDAVAGNRACGTSPAGRLEELFEVEDPGDLAVAASMLRLRKIRDLVRGGVVVQDPASAWIDLGVRIGRDTVISPSVIIEGRSAIGRGVRIFPNVRISDSTIGDGAVIRDFTIVEDSVLEGKAEAGPFSRLRPGTRVRSGARVGNFVEMKNTDFGRGSKALHLSYLGDSEIGRGVNIGAGTITCNYDGVRKNKTTIGDGAFIGSGTELVAPVRVGRRAYVAAGSTITKDVGEGSLAVARARQVEKPGWVSDREVLRKRESSRRRPRR